MTRSNETTELYNQTGITSQSDSGTFFDSNQKGEYDLTVKDDDGSSDEVTRTS